MKNLLAFQLKKEIVPDPSVYAGTEQIIRRPPISKESLIYSEPY